MNQGHPNLSRALRVLLLAAGVAASAVAGAAAPAAARPSADRPTSARCPYGIATDGSPNCMTKADFEVMRARQDALDRDPAQYVRNAMVRCERLEGDDRKDCIARIGGKGTTSGSVEGGGIYRELVTRTVGTPPVPPPGEDVPVEPKK